MTMLIRRNPRLSTVMILTLGSQALSAGGTLLLHFLGLSAADTYSVSAQIGLTGFTGVTVGILYNIAIGRPGFEQWRRWALIAAFVSIGAAVLQGILLSTTGFVGTHGAVFVWIVFLLFGGGGALISAAATDGVREACNGRPVLFASTTVFPNAGLVLGIVIGGLTKIAVIPAIGWFVASAALFVLAKRAPRTETQSAFTLPTRRGARSSKALRSQVAGLTLGVLASTLMPMLYLAALSQLALGVVYLATLVSRIVNASVALTVNSALLVRFNWATNAGKLGTSSQATALVSAVLLLASSFVTCVGSPTGVENVLVVCGWLSGVIASSILVRHLNATRRGRTILLKAIIEVGLTAIFAAVLFIHPSFAGYFGCFALSSALTILVSGLVLRYPWIGVSGGVSLFATVVVILCG